LLNKHRQAGEYDGVEEEKSTPDHINKKHSSSSKPRILLVDDEPDITFTLKNGLVENGFVKVDTFNDPLLALSSFKPGFYDLILLDVKMPKMNGFDLYQEIEKRDKNLKACFITAYEVYYESLKKEFPGLNVGCFITKPIEMENFIARIKAELESK
jgi:DNA-binding response OmpR family regulator